MTRVDEHGWVRDFSERPTLPEIHVVTGSDLLDAAEAFVRAAKAADTYGSDPDPYLLHAAYASQTRLQQPGAVPTEIIEDMTAPISFDDVTPVEVDTSDFEEVE
jgi:hypothetical protein